MDIKWKNNRKKIIITIVVLIAFTLGTMAFFPGINRRGMENLENMQILSEATGENSTNAEVLESLYKGCYVLYKEETERQTGVQVNGSDLFIETYPAAKEIAETESDMKTVVNQYMDDVINGWAALFEDYRANVDYCVIAEDGQKLSNTSRPLQDVVKYDSAIEELVGYYTEIFGITFDENGAMEVEPYFTRSSNSGDAIIKELGQVDRKNLLLSTFDENFGSTQIRLRRPKNLQVIFAIPANSVFVSLDTGDEYTQNWQRMNAYVNAGAQSLYGAVALLLIGFAFFMNSKKIWKENVMIRRPGKCYLMEAALVGIFGVLGMLNTLVSIIWQHSYSSIAEVKNIIHTEGVYEAAAPLAESFFLIFCCYAVWYASVFFLQPVFSLGWKAYIRQYSFFYQIFPWLKMQWNRFQEEISHIDFQEKSTKTIVKIVVLNFIVLSILSFLWFFGIFALAIYSVVLFYLLKKNYDKIGKDYQTLLRGVNRIAEGDLNTVITEDLGVFEPFRNELVRIRNGFKKAVDEEVKSQRMKTELITNVSHDLKTPLTAITTYIELLKKEDITEEERRSYIETLEKKSLRLKILIEDLFEVSKATTDNIVLTPIDLDVVNLMKQVSIEHVEKMQEKGIELRWNIPEEKVMVRLDNQKTYRIFENLFVNVQKYAMPNSRVYAEVKTSEKNVEIVLKNMSAEELNFSAEEITERFVRGDSSRNTEGSGLGLAIAKSFTEAQGGRFRIEVDGDLFKAILEFPLLQM